MKDEQTTEGQLAVATSAAEGSATAPAPSEQLENIDDIDFLLEEIENKIAPLALA